MCGLCNFGCCNHKSFHVEITEEEQKSTEKVWFGFRTRMVTRWML